MDYGHWIKDNLNNEKKKMNRVLFILLTILTIGFTACEKNIDVDFPPGEKPYVIEGYIENGVVPIISISRGVSFLSTITSNDFNNLFVNNATVSISVDGGAPILMTPINIGGATIYTNLNLSGEVGKTYDLKVEVDGKVFTASTKILPPQPLDSIVYVQAEGDRGTKDSLVELTAWYTDPIAPENYSRILTKKNSEPFYDVAFNSVYNDFIINGKQISFTVFGGKQALQNNDSADFSQYGYFKRGDTVYVKWASIDKNQYEFWNTFESQSGSFGNPFAPTVLIKSNIKGAGGIGIWASYGASIDTVIIPK